MEKNQPVRQGQEDAGKWVMDILISLLKTRQEKNMNISYYLRMHRNTIMTHGLARRKEL